MSLTCHDTHHPFSSPHTSDTVMVNRPHGTATAAPECYTLQELVQAQVTKPHHHHHGFGDLYGYGGAISDNDDYKTGDYTKPKHDNSTPAVKPYHTVSRNQDKSKHSAHRSSVTHTCGPGTRTLLTNSEKSSSIVIQTVLPHEGKCRVNKESIESKGVGDQVQEAIVSKHTHRSGTDSQPTPIISTNSSQDITAAKLPEAENQTKIKNMTEGNDIPTKQESASTTSNTTPLQISEIRHRHQHVGDDAGVRLKQSSAAGSQCPGYAALPAMEQPGATSAGVDDARDHAMRCQPVTKGSTMPLPPQEYGQASPQLRSLLEGLNQPGDSGNPPVPPAWLDRDLFERGKKFYGHFLFCIFFSDLLALLMVFCVPRILRPLIYTGRSDTPGRALRRYVSTILHIITWYSGDVWDPHDPAHTDIIAVRTTHKNLASTLNSTKHHKQVREICVEARGHYEPCCPLGPGLRQDLGPQVCADAPILEYPHSPTTYISQWDMLFTQYSFLGVIVAHPWRVGAWWASTADLEGLVHFWRGVGWLLGIEDRYNFCSGGLVKTRALCKEMEKLVVQPGLADSTWSYEHMSTSLVDGMNKLVPCLSLPPMLRFLADTLHLRSPSLVATMTWTHTLQYWLMRFIFHILFLIPGTVLLFNQLLIIALRNMQNQNTSWFSNLPKL